METWYRLSGMGQQVGVTTETGALLALIGDRDTALARLGAENRRLRADNAALVAIHTVGGQMAQSLDVSQLSIVDVDQFYGLEIAE